MQERGEIDREIRIKGRGHVERDYVGGAGRWHDMIEDLLLDFLPCEAVSINGGPGKAGRQVYMFARSQMGRAYDLWEDAEVTARLKEAGLAHLVPIWEGIDGGGAAVLVDALTEAAVNPETILDGAFRPRARAVRQEIEARERNGGAA